MFQSLHESESCSSRTAATWPPFFPPRLLPGLGLGSAPQCPWLCVSWGLGRDSSSDNPMEPQVAGGREMGKNWVLVKCVTRIDL